MIFRIVAALNLNLAPPWPSTNCFATNKPMPVPTVLRVVKKASNTFDKCSAAIPTPSSWTVKTMLSFAKIAIYLQNKQMKVHSTWLESR